MRTFVQLAMGCIFGLLATGVLAQEPTTQATPAMGTQVAPGQAEQTQGMVAGQTVTMGGAAQLSEDDQKFVHKAASSGLYEVQSSQLAQQRATTPEAKSFAQRMVADHTKANQELMALAQRKGIQVPQQLAEKEQKNLDKLQKAEANEFDKEYMSQQTKAHEEAVELFEKASKDAKDPDLKAFAAKTLPALKEHHQMAKGGKDAAKSAEKKTE